MRPLDKLRAAGATLEPSTRSTLGRSFRADGVRDSAEFRRIASLVRRVRDDEVDAAIAAELSPLLAKSGGAMSLRGIQGASLHELSLVGGLIAAIRVGGGKTLITFLASLAVDAKRPLLLHPAKLRAKTIDDFAALAEHFDVDVVPALMSYELLGREQASEALRELRPDLVIADEGHKLKNPKAAVTRRVRRYLSEDPTCRLVVLSGTLLSKKVGEAAHLFEWALAERSPLPRKHGDVVEWGLALDVDLAPGAQRLTPGALAQFFDANEAALSADDETEAARCAVRRRITETPGVIATTGAFTGASLTITLVQFDGYSSETEQAFATVRDGWTTPDGFVIPDAVSRWRHLIELAQGFYYVWDPRPPVEWITARRSWHQTVRHILDHNRRELDSEQQVRGAVVRGDYRGETLYSNGFRVGDGTVDENLSQWLDVRDTFDPNTVPVWIDDGLVEYVRAWSSVSPGIVWVQSVALGERLSAVLGLPYHGAETKDARGRRIKDVRPAGGSIVASIASCGEGENLQTWCRNLVIAGTLSGEKWEQLLGRTHRDGQTADEVTVDVLIGCAEQLAGYEKALDQARFARDVQGQEQKLLYADTAREIKPGSGGPRWTV